MKCVEKERESNIIHVICILGILSNQKIRNKVASMSHCHQAYDPLEIVECICVFLFFLGKLRDMIVEMGEYFLISHYAMEKTSQIFQVLDELDLHFMLLRIEGEDEIGEY